MFFVACLSVNKKTRPIDLTVDALNMGLIPHSAHSVARGKTYVTKKLELIPDSANSATWRKKSVIEG